MGVIKSITQVSLILGGFGILVLGLFSAINPSFLPIGSSLSWIVAGSGIALSVFAFVWIYRDNSDEREELSWKELVLEAIDQLIDALLTAA